MTILNKALTRPAALWGVPLVPLLFTLSILTLAAVWSRFYWLLLLLIPAFIELRRLAKEDIHFFDLKYPAVPLSPLVFPPARAGGEEQKR